MPLPTVWAQRRAEKQGQLTELNKFSEATIGETARTQLRSDNLLQQPFKIAVTSRSTGPISRKFRVTMSHDPAAPKLHGYVAMRTGVSGGDYAADFFGTEQFVEVQRGLTNGTATYEFDFPPAKPGFFHPENAAATVGSQFILADAPLGKDGAAPKNIYWFYLEDFKSR